MSYSKYLAQTYESWNAKHGIVFAEPIRKRDEKLFTKKKCTFCREEFFVDRKLEPKPEACEKCFAARNASVSAMQKPNGPADDHKIQIPKR
jgi:hypothetical protein